MFYIENGGMLRYVAKAESAKLQNGWRQFPAHAASMVSS
jgi:hypothetical protein